MLLKVFKKITVFISIHLIISLVFFVQVKVIATKEFPQPILYKNENDDADADVSNKEHALSFRNKMFSLPALLFGSNIVHAAFNPEINYQGKLLDSTGATVADGLYTMYFGLYTAPTGGTAIWTESRTGGDQVQVTSGLFSVMLGDVSSLTSVDFNQTLYLGVTIASDSEMSPRKVIGAVPAAFVSESTNTFGGALASQYLRNDIFGTLNVNSTNTALTIDQSGSGGIFSLANNGTNRLTVLGNGNVGVGTSTPYGNLHIAGTGVVKFFVENTESGGEWVRFSAGTGGSSMKFSNTAGFSIGAVSSKDDANVVDDFYVSGSGLVGIGTTTPQAPFHVSSDSSTTIRLERPSVGGGWNWGVGNGGFGTTRDLIFRPVYQDNRVGIQNQGAAALRWWVDSLSGNTYQLGSLGIGTSTFNSKLNVVGNAAIGSTYSGIAAPANGLIVEGDVGIGTTTPATALDVVGRGGFSDGIVLTGTPTGVSDVNYIRALNSASTVGFLAGSGTFSASSGPYFGARGNTYSAISGQRGMMFLSAGAVSSPTGLEGTILFSTTPGSGTGESVRMIIDRSGNVGIGTTAPAHGLHVRTATTGNTLQGRFENTSTGQPAGFRMSGTSGWDIGFRTIPSVAWFDISNSGGTSQHQWNATNYFLDPTGRIGFAQATLSSSAAPTYDNAYFDRPSASTIRTPGTFIVGGNVGIGTTTPSHKLTIAGDTNITGALRFSGSAGTNGQILQSTGSTANWVATSTLGFAGLSDLASYVPYTGATTNLNLGDNSLTIGKDFSGGNPNVTKISLIAEPSDLGDGQSIDWIWGNTSVTTARIRTTAIGSSSDKFEFQTTQSGILTTALSLGETSSSFTGTLSASNLSGTNSGDVTLAGQNYLTLSGQQITAGLINLGSHATGTLSVANGGTGQTTFTNGQLLIGNTTGNTLTKATLTGTSNQITVTNGAGSITLSTPQNIDTSATPQFSRLGLGAAADASIPFSATRNTSGLTDISRLINSATAANNNGANLSFISNRTTGGATPIAGIGGIITDINNTAYKGALVFSTANNATPAERMRINNVGNVGIGVQFPQARLHVNGDILMSDGADRSIGVSTKSGYYAGDNLSLFAGSAGAGPMGSGNEGGNVFIYGGTGNGAHSGNVILAHKQSWFEPVGKVGIGTTTPSHLLTVAGDTNITGALRFSGSAGTNGQILQSTGSTAQWWTPNYLSTTTLNTLNPIQVGNGNTASGANSSVFGFCSTASTLNSAVFGRSNFTGTGDAAVVIGILNNQTGGSINTTSGAITGTPVAVNSGDLSTAVGIRNTASGARSAAVGYNNTVSGVYASAFGASNNVSGVASYAFGAVNTASGVNSTASGYYNTASGYRSYTFGHRNVTSGCCSSAFGICNTAAGNCSSVSGYRSTASTLNSQVFGRSNFTGTGDAAVVIGILNNQTGGSINTTSGAITGTPVAVNSGDLSTAVGIRNTAIGPRSSAFGYANTASGSYSSAFGYANTASGYVSTASGNYNTASGSFSTAFGYSNTASGYRSSAFGFDNNVSGVRSSAFGFENNVSGEFSVGFGGNNATDSTVSGYLGALFGAVALGFGNSSTASGYYGAGSSAVGINNTASSYRSSAFGYGNTASGPGSSAFGYTNTTSGNYSSAFGYQNQSSGDYSVAIGGNNVTNSTASGYYGALFGAVALGFGNSSTASGYSGAGSSAVGINNTASSVFSSAFGYNNTASGNYSSAFGFFNTASGSYSSASGSFNTASGSYSSAFGYQNQSLGDYSITIGGNNIASSTVSGYSGAQFGAVALGSGNNSTASGYYGAGSSAVGVNNTASGDRSSAFGYANNASEDRSSAFGFDNNVSGVQSSAFGYNNTTSGYSSSAFGNNLSNSVADSAMIGSASGFLRIRSSGQVDSSTGASLTTGGAWTNSSSEDLKENFTPIDTEEILSKIAQLRLEQWNYKTEDASITHIGPLAEEFYDLFGLGGNNKSISSIDPAGIALVGIQELYKRIDWIGEYVTQTTDGIVGFFKELTVDRLNINGEICVDDVCISKEQFKNMIQNSGGTNGGSGSTNNTSDSNGSDTSDDSLDNSDVTESEEDEGEEDQVGDILEDSEPEPEIVIEDESVDLPAPDSEPEPVPEEESQEQPTSEEPEEESSPEPTSEPSE